MHTKAASPERGKQTKQNQPPVMEGLKEFGPISQTWVLASL